MVAAVWFAFLFQFGGSVALLYAATRLARHLERRGPVPPPSAPPRVMIAATGPLPDLERLRDALAAQTVALAGLTFTVESTDDPAHARIAAVFAAFPAPVALVVAGQATVGGQKSRNLVAALCATADDEPLVLADVDILPQRDWLATLLRPIERGTADVVSGYRWPVPLDARLPTLLATWIDRAIAALPKRVGGQLVWGGSVALAAGVADRIGLAEGLEREISDDLFLAERARRHGLRVTFAPGALPATPTRHDWRSLAGFGRRQYQMVRLYAPVAYAGALAIAAINLAATAWLLTAMVVTWNAAAAYGLVAILSVLITRGRSRVGAAASIAVADARAERSLYALAALTPLVHLVHLVLILGALRVRTIRWGRYTYRMRGRAVVAIERREG